jgi:hypothetical protein
VISATALEALARAWRAFEAWLEPPETGNSGLEGWGRDPFQAIDQLYVAIETGRSQLQIDQRATDSSADWDEMAHRWRAFGGRLPDRWGLGGIAFRGGGGPRRWAAFLVRAEDWQTGPTAEGADPFEAIDNLQKALD